MEPLSAQEIVDRARTVWPLGTVRYSMVSTASPTGHRCDCSGFASAVLELATPGLTTVTLVTTGVLRPIFKSELAPGDFIGDLDLGSEGANGHVQAVTAVRANTVDVIEQAGGTVGPTRATVTRASIREAYRYTQEVPVDVLRANNPDQGEIDAWRLDALTYGLEEVRGGPLAGEPVYVVQALKRIEAAVAAGGAAAHRHTTGPAEPVDGPAQ